MNWFFFILFLILTLVLIWNGKDQFSKKQWFRTGLMLLLVLVATVVISFIFKYLAQSFSLFSVATAKQYSIIFSMSLLCLWGLKVVVVLLCTIFAGIMGGHKTHNAQNYEKLSSVSRVVAPSLLIVAKGLVSLGSVLIFSGLWLK
ncbi:hypothetical protein EDF73_102389 [Raoultella sp. BIGb0138]|uniref:hypothetical protein n=1 Tax=Raoultella sp. BIGb0138 TaxID=2485115 RepID=UPI0010CF39E2|nr:hypothetical protein [Raoultella sp. BIGb0138]TCW16580.1 hypothetical protein EDF73_102389 [Raoultella sp. BIGb0138]